MSLTSKIVLILSAVVALYALTDYAIQRVTVTRSFHALEEAEARRDMDRVIEAIREEEAQLDQYCQSRASMADTRAYVVGMGWRGLYPVVHPELLQEVQRYRANHLGAAALRRDKIDLLYLCDLGGRVLWGRIRQPGSEEAVQLRDFPGDRLGTAHPLLARGVIEDVTRSGGDGARRDVDSRRGIFLTERGPMLVSSRRIVDPDGARARGTLIVGRFIGPELIRVLAARTKVHFDLWPIRSAQLSAEEREALSLVAASASRPHVREQDETLLHVYATVPDIRMAPVLLVRANLERRISPMAGKAMRYALLSTITVGLLMLLVLLALLQRTVLAPITTLTRDAVAIGRGEDVPLGWDLGRNDEIGILSREFRHMLEKLAESRAALVRTARAAGMSEIATGILHNVGNVLNSVNVSASMVGRRARGLCVEDLESLSRVLSEHADDLASFVESDERGRHLRPYVDALAREMRDAQRGIDEELGALTRGVDHIRELINSQQSYVGRGGVTEPVSVEDQLEEALSISEKALSRDSRLEVVRDYASLEPIVADRHKLLEILVNLIQNARQAMAQSPSQAHRITLSTRELGDDVRIEVRDNGPGIDADDMVRIFNLGFTTRADGHGVGLHASANAAKEMSGKLSVHSEGRGHGACFVLELPKRAACLEEVAT